MRRILLTISLSVMLALIGAPADAHTTPRRSPDRQLLTIFGCESGGTLFTYSLWSTLIIPCAEHLGDGHYRSWVEAETWRNSTGLDVPANYGFYDQKLYYYCDTNCILYDNDTNFGYIQVFSAVSKGNSITCPGASNSGKVDVDRVDVRYPDNVLKSWLTTQQAYPIQFNSNC